jgi:pimeloyl-ACP methyl ester carboxylesterase
MATVVGVHGAFHELWGPNQVASRWLPALRDGLALAGAELDAGDFTVAFYGDLFRHDPEALPAPSDADLLDVAQRAGLLEVATKVAGPDGLAVIAKAVGDEMLRRLVDQAGRYFADPETRARVGDRVAAAVTPDTRVVVAHSLGSIVAYEVLCAHPEWSVSTLVTIGSPLGAETFVRPHLHPAPVDGTCAWPGPVRTWVNIASVGDQACQQQPRLAPAFGPEVVDHLVDNGHRAHDPEPYLCSAATGHAVARGLAGD